MVLGLSAAVASRGIVERSASGVCLAAIMAGIGPGVKWVL